MTEQQFQAISRALRKRLKKEAYRTGDLGDDLFVHGSRAIGAAASDADLDIGIRVTSEKFEQLIRVRLVRTSSKTDRYETLQEALHHGRLHAGEAGISGIRKEIQRLVNVEMRLAFEKGVQVTVIRERGPFDQGPFIPLPGEV
jgi:hypothetical protein